MNAHVIISPPPPVKLLAGPLPPQPPDAAHTLPPLGYPLRRPGAKDGVEHVVPSHYM
jgi:hypothetical protein